LEVLPEIVRNFIITHVRSIDVLEILFLLRQQPGKEWSAWAVSKALGLDRANVEGRLQRLVSGDLLIARNVGNEETFRYQPLTAELAQAVDEVAKWYSSHLVSVVSLIYSLPSEELRFHVPQSDDVENQK